MMLAKQGYEHKTFAIIDIGYVTTMKTARQQVLVKSVIGSVADGWAVDASHEDRYNTLRLLATKWENAILTTPPELWPHVAMTSIAQLTALGVMVSELPVTYQWHTSETHAKYL